jgi:hypothetical protein
VAGRAAPTGGGAPDAWRGTAALSDTGPLVPLAKWYATPAMENKNTTTSQRSTTKLDHTPIATTPVPITIVAAPVLRPALAREITSRRTRPHRRQRTGVTQMPAKPSNVLSPHGADRM